jgi:hypothetical protein
MQLTIKVTDPKELDGVLELIKDRLTSVEVILGERGSERSGSGSGSGSANVGGGYAEPTPNVTQVSKRGFCKSIPTVGLRGIEYRSRVEAKWAYMFDGLGWQWTYEPEDAPGYIPDFCLTWGSLEMVIEIKSNSSFAALCERFNGDYEKARECLRGRPFILLGGAVWKNDHGTLIGMGKHGSNTFSVFVVGDGFDHWHMKLLSDDGKLMGMYPPQSFDQILDSQHTTVNSMWISASNKFKWKPTQHPQ